MRQQKKAFEDGRGEVFSKKVMFGYPGKLVVSTEIGRPEYAKNNRKMMEIKQETGQIKKSKVPIEGGGT